MRNKLSLEVGFLKLSHTLTFLLMFLLMHVGKVSEDDKIFPDFRNFQTTTDKNHLEVDFRIGQTMVKQYFLHQSDTSIAALCYRCRTKHGACYCLYLTHF